MSTAQIIQAAERLPWLERFQVIEALYASIKREMAKKTMPIAAEQEEPFELITFDLGQEVHADRGADLCRARMMVGRRLLITTRLF